MRAEDALSARCPQFGDVEDGRDFGQQKRAAYMGSRGEAAIPCVERITDEGVVVLVNTASRPVLGLSRVYVLDPLGHER